MDKLELILPNAAGLAGGLTGAGFSGAFKNSPQNPYVVGQTCGARIAAYYGYCRNINLIKGTTNCGPSAEALDQTLGGKPTVAGNTGPELVVDVAARVSARAGTTRTFMPGQTQASIQATLMNAGTGSRGIVFGYRGPGVWGHYFNAVRIGNRVIFLDPQTGGTASCVGRGYQDLWFIQTNP